MLPALTSVLYAKHKTMKKTTRRGNLYITWALRILLIFMILFFALFSADVFDEEQGFWNIVEGLLMHNIPSFVMIVILIIAWKWENIGGLLLMLGILAFTAFIFSGSRNFMWGTVFMLGVPFMIGGLFIINYYLLGHRPADKETTAT